MPVCSLTALLVLALIAFVPDALLQIPGFRSSRKAVPAQFVKFKIQVCALRIITHTALHM